MKKIANLKYISQIEEFTNVNALCDCIFVVLALVSARKGSFATSNALEDVINERHLSNGDSIIALGGEAERARAVSYRRSRRSPAGIETLITVSSMAAAARRRSRRDRTYRAR